MTRIETTSMLVLLIALLAAGTAPNQAAELSGRVVAPAGSSPAVIFLRGVAGGQLPDTDTVITHQSDGTFEPAVAIGFVGNEFVFQNEDDALHTTHLYLHLAYQREISRRPLRNGATLYNIAMPLQGMEVRRPIKQYFEFTDQTGIIDVRCNPHPDETATILVFDHPYAAVSGANGAFTIPNVPAGSHDVWIWHGGEASLWRTVEVGASGATEVTVEVGAE